MTAILFDLDGTLIDSLPTVRDAANAVLSEWLLPPLSDDVVAGFVGLGEQVFIDRLIAATALAVGDRRAVLRRFMEHYELEARTTRLFPGVTEALEALRQAGWPLGLVTNKPRAPLATTLQAAGLAADFGVVVAGDDLPRRKPDPLPVQHAMEALSVTSCIYVGDSETDAATAANAGVPFVLFTEGIRTVAVSEMTYDAVFSDFADLPGILADLNAQEALR